MRSGCCAQRVVSLVASLALLGACADVETYAERRAWDASDVVRAHVMAGTGLDLKVEATRFVACGGGAYTADAWGYANRQLGAWRETIADFALFLPQPGFAANLHHESNLVGVKRVSGSYEMEADGFGSGSKHGSCATGNQAHAGYQSDDPCPLDWLTVRVTAFCFVGFDLELRLGEVVDFLGGVAGLDLSGDDRVVPGSTDAPVDPGGE